MRSSPVIALIASLALTGPALAKLPPPSDDAKAKAAEAAAKAAWAAKASLYKVCQIEDRLAKDYRASVKDAPAAVPTGPCARAGNAFLDVWPADERELIESRKADTFPDA